MAVTRSKAPATTSEKSNPSKGTVVASPVDIDFSTFPEGTYARYGITSNPLMVLRGGMSILFLWATWLGGISAPLWMTVLFLRKCYVPFAIGACVIGYPYVFKVKPWPAFIRFILEMGYWFRGGTSLVVEDDFKDVDVNGPVMLCMHPHGIFCQSFFLNGAARIHARVPEVYLPPSYQHMSTKSTGVAEPLLFQIPLIKQFVEFFGCVEPASKEGMKAILARKVPFGILPGGSDELICTERGKENIFILNRKGFIKYALQYGYTLSVGYCFGESDLYYTPFNGYLRDFRLSVLKRTKVLLFSAFGQWYCPFLPLRGSPLNTVIGNPITLPRIDNPTQEQIDKYHALYIEKLVDLFERNKGRFGYKDRTLNLI